METGVSVVLNEFVLKVFSYFRISRRRWSSKRSFLKNFVIFTGKHLCRSLFFKKRLQRRCFPENFSRFKSTFFIEHPWLLLFLTIFVEKIGEKEYFIYNDLMSNIVCFIKWKIGVNCFIFKTILHWIWGHFLKHREKAFRKFSRITDVFRTLLNILDGAFCENTVNNYELLTIFTKHCNRDVCKGLRGLWINDLKSKSKIWKEHFWKDITVSAPLHFLLGRYHFQSQILKRGGDLFEFVPQIFAWGDLLYFLSKKLPKIKYCFEGSNFKCWSWPVLAKQPINV